MKILIAPLNWGLGHATRCIPLVTRFLNEGHEVVLAGDGASFNLLRRHFPQLHAIVLPSLSLKYSCGDSQVWVMVRQLPYLLYWCVCDHLAIKKLCAVEHFDRVVSDNRFGLFLSSSSHIETIYLTHQLHIVLPAGWKWLEPMVERIHRCIIRHYTECWIPDYENAPGLAGKLSHPLHLPDNAIYIGPLSRFPIVGGEGDTQSSYGKVAIISGLEPHRTFLEQALREEANKDKQEWLFLTGRVEDEQPTDVETQAALLSANQIICRSGYSTIMDLEALGVLFRATLIPTPGQSEQEYLAELHCS